MKNGLMAEIEDLERHDPKSKAKKPTTPRKNGVSRFSSHLSKVTGFDQPISSDPLADPYAI